jgi:type I restriction enzyme, S subunit
LTRGGKEGGDVGSRTYIIGCDRGEFMKNSKYKLDRLATCTAIDTGFPFKSERFTDSSDDIPLVKGDNLQQGYVDWYTAKYWSRLELQDFQKYWLEPNDVVLAMDRPWVQAGLKWSCIKIHDLKALLVQRVARLRAKKNMHQQFVRCLIGSEYFSSCIQPIVTGVNVPHISSKQIGDVLVPIPPYSVQEKIAAIVASYDDLIDNNDRRITLLEKMAEEIYREWFVRLRFPGHEQAIFHKGIPEGWEIKKLENVVELAYGKALKEEDRVPGIYPVFGSSGIIGTHKSFLVKAPGIIVGRKGNVGSINWSEQDFYPIDTVYFVKSNLNFYFLFFLLQSLNFINNDAAVPGLNRSQAYANNFYLPPLSLINKYSKTAKDIFDFKSNLKKQNILLKQTRDRLLTRLISGKLSVEDLDIQFPPSMNTGVDSEGE